MSECSLCEKSDVDLQKSHVIPSFVFRWLKKSSATPFLRKPVEPQKRVQDHHERMLCRDCEQRLSKWESKFAGKIFYPYVRGNKSEFEYERWLKKFIISVSWRLIQSKLTETKNLTEYQTRMLKKAEEHWKEVLTEDRKGDYLYEHHMFLYGFVDESERDLPDNFEWYTHRSIDGTLIVDDYNSIHIYFKFPKIAFISSINPKHISGMIGTKIRRKGEIKISQKVSNVEIGDFLIGRADRVNKLQKEEKLPEDEKQKIIDHMDQNIERVQTSESVRVHIRNYYRNSLEKWQEWWNNWQKVKS